MQRFYRVKVNFIVHDVVIDRVTQQSKLLAHSLKGFKLLVPVTADNADDEKEGIVGRSIDKQVIDD